MSNIFSEKTCKNLEDVTTLNKAEKDRAYVVVACYLPRKLKERFAELGLVEGATVTVVKAAPLGDPLELSVADYLLCVRAKELKHFKVKKVDDE